MPKRSLPSPLNTTLTHPAHGPDFRKGENPGDASTNCLVTDSLGEESGQGLTEYLVLLLLIAVISISAARTLGSTIRGKLQMAERHIDGVQLESRD